MANILEALSCTDLFMTFMLVHSLILGVFVVFTFLALGLIVAQKWQKRDVGQDRQSGSEDRTGLRQFQQGWGP